MVAERGKGRLGGVASPGRFRSLGLTTDNKKEEARAGSPPPGHALNDTGLRFNGQAPVIDIAVTPPEIEGLSEDDYEVVSERVHCRLAALECRHVVIRYRNLIACASSPDDPDCSEWYRHRRALRNRSRGIAAVANSALRDDRGHSIRPDAAGDERHVDRFPLCR